MRNVSDKICRENQNTHFVFSDFFSKIVSFMRKFGKHIVERGGYKSQHGTRALHAWIPKASETHLQHAKRIAFPLQQWLRERAVMLC
jgi:hypothetical protein